jgi:hypothetical protein
MHVLLELLNKVWGLEGCPLKGQTMLTNRSVRFDFGVATVLSALMWSASVVLHDRGWRGGWLD